MMMFYALFLNNCGTSWNVFHLICIIQPMSGCKACSHPNRQQIDNELVSGVPVRTIIAQFPTLSLGGITRHKQCIRESLAQAQERSTGQGEERGSALLERVLRLAGEAEEILKAAKSSNDFRGANGALGAAAKLLDLCGRLSGELSNTHAPGIHFHSTRISNTVINVQDDDRELAVLVSEATKNFDPRTIEHLRLLASSTAPAPE